MRIVALRYDRPKGDETVASRQSVPVTGIAGLQRAARLAGESFGHEDVVSASLSAENASSRWLWWLAAIAASAGLAALHFY